MINGVKNIKFKTYKDETSAKLLEKYNTELKNYNVYEHIETIRSLFKMDHIFNIRNYLNSYFPDV